MTIASFVRIRFDAVLILAVFSLVILLFAGCNFVDSPEHHGNLHQLNGYSCLSVTCVAIFNLSILLTVFLYAAAVLNNVPIPQSEKISLIEKPPRKRPPASNFIIS